ncbi:MAG: exodeoxyribonuclease VII large subunit [Longimicrobiales bacterium]
MRRATAWNLEAAAAEAYSVTAVNALAREALEGVLPPLWIEGEVTGWKRHTSGHCYFCLRDARSQLRAVMFRLDAQRLPADPDEGMKVRVFGTVTLYERRGEYQFVVRELEGRGAGGLWRLAFERLRRKLDAEGLLAPERKRPLPRHPTTVGVVTSPVGAALHDILQVIRARAPWTRVVLAPAKVQGDGAAYDLARAIRLFRSPAAADIVIVGRGGGSVEDLWAFNEEVLARAIAACPVPIISAVGHEVDVTIADLVADHRAPTPSAAAERAVPDQAAVARELFGLRMRLESSVRRTVARRRDSAVTLQTELEAAIRRAVSDRRRHVAVLADKLDTLSPLGALRRGYAVPLGEDGRILRHASDFRPGEPLALRIVDGTVSCRTEAVEEENET